MVIFLHDEKQKNNMIKYHINIYYNCFLNFNTFHVL